MIYRGNILKRESEDSVEALIYSRYSHKTRTKADNRISTLVKISGKYLEQLCE
jgi:hypothetical protein